MSGLPSQAINKVVDDVIPDIAKEIHENPLFESTGLISCFWSLVKCPFGLGQWWSQKTNIYIRDLFRELASIPTFDAQALETMLPAAKRYMRIKAQSDTFNYYASALILPFLIGVLLLGPCYIQPVWACKSLIPLLYFIFLYLALLIAFLIVIIVSFLLLAFLSNRPKELIFLSLWVIWLVFLIAELTFWVVGSHESVALWMVVHLPPISSTPVGDALASVITSAIIFFMVLFIFIICNGRLTAWGVRKQLEHAPEIEVISRLSHALSKVSGRGFWNVVMDEWPSRERRESVAEDIEESAYIIDTELTKGGWAAGLAADRIVIDRFGGISSALRSMKIHVLFSSSTVKFWTFLVFNNLHKHIEGVALCTPFPGAIQVVDVLNQPPAGVP